MRRQFNKINRIEDNRIRGTHSATIVTQPTDGNIPNSIDLIKLAERNPMPIPLTPIEKTAIEVQDAIRMDHFIRSRTANVFAPALQQYYTNNKIRSFSAPIGWSNAINKCNFITHHSAWKKYCSEIISPVRTKNTISQRNFYLLSLVEKYYNQAADLPKLQSQWFARPIIKYQK